MKPKPNDRPRTAEWLYRAASWCPPLLLAALLIFGFAKEQLANRQLHEQLSALQEQGVPLNHVARAEVQDASTTRDQAATWGMTLSATSSLRNMRTDDVSGETRLVPPDEPWPAEPMIAVASERAQPVLTKLRALLQSDAAVWQPVRLETGWDWNPAIDDLRSLQLVLADEFRIAVHAGERDQAIETLQTMDQVLRRFGMQFSVPSGFFSREDTPLWLIRQSVAFPFWELKHIDALEKLASPREDEASAWEESVDGRLSSFVSYIGDVSKLSVTNWQGQRGPRRSPVRSVSGASQRVA